MIRGVGIDAVDVERFRLAMQRRGGRFLERLFTPFEIAYCKGKRRPEEHFSARFAAKVSVFKALGARSRFIDIEIRRSSDGAPEAVFLRGARKGDARLFVSISHDAGVSLASAIAEFK